MDKRASFLKSVLGQEGFSALEKATKANDSLGSAIVARSVLSWLDVISRNDFEGTVPGNDAIKVSLQKSNDAFQGTITIAKDILSFKNARLSQVAGSVAVALDLDHKVSDQVPAAQLMALGKSLDLLVKARFVNAHKAQEPVKAPAVLPTLHKALPKPRLPHVKHLVPIAKEALLSDCAVCSTRFFKADKFVGCLCFEGIKNGVNLLRKNGEPVLSFGPNLDQDAILAILEALKG